MQHRRGIGTAGVMVAVLAFGACSDPVDRVSSGGDGGEGTSTTTTTGPPTTADPDELTGTPPPEAPSTPECPPPHLPVVSPGELERLPFAGYESVAVGPPSQPVLDSDGNGEPDEVVRDPEDQRATVRRGDGDLVFEREGERLTLVPLADLDGDGRNELLVGVVVGPDGASGGRPPMYVVPGSTEVGAHDPADVGVRVARPVATIGDHDGDGVEDLLEYDGDPPTRVLSGAEVIAVGAGNDARSLDPLRYVPGTALAHADLGGSTTWITVEMESESSSRYTVHAVDDTGDRRFTTPPGEPAVGPTLGSVGVQVGEGGTFLIVSPSSGRGSPSGPFPGYVWRLDDPCGPLPTTGG